MSLAEIKQLLSSPTLDLVCWYGGRLTLSHHLPLHHHLDQVVEHHHQYHSDLEKEWKYSLHINQVQTYDAETSVS